MLFKFSCGSYFIGLCPKGIRQWLIQSKFLIYKDFCEVLQPRRIFFWHSFVFWRKQKAGELDFEELGIVFPGRRDTIVSYNNALFLQRERNPADLVEPLFGNRCSIIRSDLRHCSAFTHPAPGNNLRVSINCTEESVHGTIQKIWLITLLKYGLFDHFLNIHNSLYIYHQIKFITRC